jgi:hypothetical protein
VGGSMVVDGPRTFTGTYMVKGPTETKTGTFSYTTDHGPTISYPVVLTDRYPEYLDLWSQVNATYPGSGGPLFAEVVDGHEMTVGVSSVSFDLGFGSAMLVPEPSTLAMLAALLVAAFCLRRLHRRRKANAG